MQAEQLSTLPEYGRGALRSKLVARLTGLSSRQLQYWHGTGLQNAEVRAGRRGTPRLYSWIDYHRLRVIAGLLERGLSTPTIRRAIEYLDATNPDWYLRTLEADIGAAPRGQRTGRRHVAVRSGKLAILADSAGQATYRDSHSLTSDLRSVLDELEREGPLFRLSRFRDAVRMDPRVNVGQPTLRGTRLETEFVARLAHMSSPDEVADLYQLDRRLVKRAIEFEEEAA